MEENVNKRLNDALSKYVRPALFPVAVKLSSGTEFPPHTKRPLRDLGERLNLCQGTALARTYGWTIGFLSEDHACGNSKAISDFSIYTVKEAKGFEFAETFVIDLDMTDHEKYIAYTRALVQMCVITSLPYHTDRSKPLYKEGIDEEGLSEEPTAG